MPSDVESGEYTGRIDLAFDSPSMEVRLQVRMKVFGFMLGRNFRSCFGGEHFLRRYGEGGLNIMDFHGLESPDKQRKLVRSYYAVLAKSRLSPFIPYYLHLFSQRQDFSDTMSQFVRRDFSGLRAKQFDFTLFDQALEQMVGLGVNSVGIGHMNGALISKMTDEDFRLLLEKYHILAQHLEERGWLDLSYILIDESNPRTYPAIARYIDTLKSQPLTSRIRICYTTDKSSATAVLDPDRQGELLLGGRVDIWTPENNDCYNFYDPLTYSRMKPPPREVWLYYTRTAHLNIDSPAVNHRLLGWKVWACGAKGFLVWASFIWDLPEPWGVRQPWVDPYTPWGNGVLAFFYPPDERGCDGGGKIPHSAERASGDDSRGHRGLRVCVASLKEAPPTQTESKSGGGDPPQGNTGDLYKSRSVAVICPAHFELAPPGRQATGGVA